MRNDHDYVLKHGGRDFTIDELKDARECLYRSTGTTRYTYKGPNEPASPTQRKSFCIASIISKISDLEKNGINPKIVCPAEELFRIMGIKNNDNSLSLEERVLRLEADVKVIKTATPANRADFPTVDMNTTYKASKRSNLLSEVVNNQGRPRSTSISSKRLRSEDSGNTGAWSDVYHKKNGENPGKRRKSYWGKNEGNQVSQELVGADVYEVFLSNYRNIATTDVVKNHFTNHNIKVLHIRQRSHPSKPVKSFVMRLAQKEDFDKVISVLPFKTGARWYDPNQYQSGVKMHYNNTVSSPSHLLDSQFTPKRTFTFRGSNSSAPPFRPFAPYERFATTTPVTSQADTPGSIYTTPIHRNDDSIVEGMDASATAEVSTSNTRAIEEFIALSNTELSTVNKDSAAIGITPLPVTVPTGAPQSLTRVQNEAIDLSPSTSNGSSK